jgi:single-strand DNA-binding protein
MAFNKVIIQGNISSEVELKQTQSGTSVCSFNVAVNRFSKEPDAKKVDFFTIVAWGAKAEFVSRYFKKGSPILVCGRLENREWQDKQGNKRISTEIIAEEVTFCGGAEKSEPTVSAPPKGNVPYMPSAYTSYPTDNFASSQVLEVPNDGDLPF